MEEGAKKTMLSPQLSKNKFAKKQASPPMELKNVASNPGELLQMLSPSNEEGSHPQISQLQKEN